MIEALILQALQKAGIAARDASSMLLPIQSLGRSAPEPEPTNGRFLEFVNIPNNDTSEEYWDASCLYQGNFRILLHWNMTDEGIYAPMQYLDEIGNFFSKSVPLVAGAATVKIYKKPSASGMIPNNSELIFPLNLPYRCFKS